MVTQLLELGAALLLGALVGIEREQAKRSPFAGMRTFPLIALVGAVCGLLLASAGPWIVVAGLVAVTALAVSGQLLHEDGDAGTTTSVAMVITYLVGVLAIAAPLPVAVAVALATTLLLYFKPQLHLFSRWLSEKEFLAFLQFGLVTFLILPILPDRAYGPFGALNPFHIWLMVVFVSGISLVGYMLLRTVGRRWGGVSLGALGGLVSSTATTLAAARWARSTPAFSQMAGVTVVLASSMVLIRLLVEVAVVHPPLVRQLALPGGLLLVIGVGVAIVAWRLGRQTEVPDLETRNPAALGAALTFAALYGLVYLGVSAANEWLGWRGVYLVGFFSGFSKMDAITLSSARLASLGELTAAEARRTILLALMGNLLFKMVILRLFGTGVAMRWAAVGLGLMAVVSCYFVIW